MSIPTLGIVHHSFYGFLYRQVDSRLRGSLKQTALDDRFAAIEVDYVDHEDLVQELQAVLPQSGLEVVVSGGTAMNRGGFSLCALEPDDRTAALAKAKRIIDFSASIGARACVFPSGRDPGDAQRRAALESFNDSMTELAVYTDQLAGESLWLTIEQMDRSFHHRQLLGPTELTAEVLRSLRKRHPRLGLTFDLAHCYQLEEAPASALATASDVIFQVHLGNCVMHDPQHPLYGDRHPPFDTPGGVVDETALHSFVPLLHATEMALSRPIVALEINTPPGDDPDLVLAAAKRVLFRSWP